MRMPTSFPAVDAGVGGLSAGWWNEINESVEWQDGIFFTLCAAYALVSLVALIQLIRIELRVPEYGWTTQKVFHFMNFIVNGVRAVMFGFHMKVFLLHPKALTLVLLDLPGLLFFSTYTLLALFWAEIYHQARSLPTDKLRISYISINSAIYFIQFSWLSFVGISCLELGISFFFKMAWIKIQTKNFFYEWKAEFVEAVLAFHLTRLTYPYYAGYFNVCIWVYLWINDNAIVEFIGKIFIAVVSFVAALGFLIYGGKLFFMLRRFPIESKGRRKKLHEVGTVTAICFTCFLIRCFVVMLSAFDSDATLDVLYHPVLNLIYYALVEILPSALVLFILRKLPPKRISAQYHPIR